MARTAVCPRHGTEGVGLACTHVAEAIDSRALVGFFWGDDTDLARPDAWCSSCEEALIALAGAASDGWFIHAQFRMLCASCWDEAKALLYRG